MPAPAGVDLSWLTKFVRDQIQQSQLAPQATAKVGTHNVKDLVVDGSVDLSGLTPFQLQALKTQLSIPAPYTGPKITVGTLAAGPPAGPVAGDIWIATTVETAANTSWQFCYKTGDTYPWKFIGGPAVHKADNTGTARANTVDNTWEYITGNPTFTLARAGVYNYEFGAQSGENGGFTQYTGVGGTFGMYNGAFQSLNGGANGMNVTSVGQASDPAFGGARAAGDVIQLRQFSPSHLNSSISFGWLAVTPVAVQ